MPTANYSNHPGKPTKPAELQLVGLDGNAFSIMGNVNRALQRAGASAEYRQLVQEDMMSGDYDHLLMVAMTVTESPEEED